jgi:small-conductance mechanosensitive channel
VKLMDTLVFTFFRGQGTHTADQRARAARHALEQALRADRVQVRVVPEGRARVLFAGDAPIAELYPEDAVLAGDESLDVYAARVATHASEVLRTEQKRSDVAEVVLSISLLVFFGLMALFLLRWIGEMTDRARQFALDHPERIPAIRVKSFEVLGSGPLGSALLAALIVGRWLLQISVVYVWLVFAFSRFTVTRPYTARLTSFVLTPLSDLAGRLVSALPIALLAVVTAALIYVIVRFVELFFASVSRGETRLSWLPIDLVLPASLLVRVGIVLLVLVFAGPVVTGDPEGSLARAGSIVMLAIALATVPLLAGVVVGIVQVFARRVRVGQHVGIGELRGRVLSVGLLDVRLQDELGNEVRVPHLLALTKPVRMHPAPTSGMLEISVAPESSASGARALLEQHMREHDADARVELQDADALGMHFRISFSAHPERAAHELRLLLVDALRASGFALGHARGRRREA